MRMRCADWTRLTSGGTRDWRRRPIRAASCFVSVPGSFKRRRANRKSGSGSRLVDWVWCLQVLCIQCLVSVAAAAGVGAAFTLSFSSTSTSAAILSLVAHELRCWRFLRECPIAVRCALYGRRPLPCAPRTHPYPYICPRPRLHLHDSAVAAASVNAGDPPRAPVCRRCCHRRCHHLHLQEPPQQRTRKK